MTSMTRLEWLERSARSEGRITFPTFLTIPVLLTLAIAAPAWGQYPAGQQGSRNISLISHLPLVGAMPLLPADLANPLGPQGTVNQSLPDAVRELGTRTADITMEQELSRPYVYVDHANEAGLNNPRIGWDIISIKDPSKPKVIYSWQIGSARSKSPSAWKDP